MNEIKLDQDFVTAVTNDPNAVDAPVIGTTVATMPTIEEVFREKFIERFIERGFDESHAIAEYENLDWSMCDDMTPEELADDCASYYDDDGDLA